MPGKRRTALISIVAATVLVLLKLVTGIITGSLGLISAGIESSGDVVAALLTLFAICLAGKPPDEQHQYGHARIENVTRSVRRRSSSAAASSSCTRSTTGSATAAAMSSSPPDTSSS